MSGHAEHDERPRKLSERRHRDGFVFRVVEALPDDPMFTKIYVAFFSQPDEHDDDEEAW